MAIVNVRIDGVAPLMMHNDRLADPLSEFSKSLAEISKRRNKTEAEFNELSRLEFIGGLYHNDAIGPYIPEKQLTACIINGAKKEKLGTSFRSAVNCVESEIVLNYPGPRDIDGLWKKKFYDRRSVGLQKVKTMRTRPIFHHWSAKFSISYDESAVNFDAVIRALTTGGERNAIGDYRPQYGRFSVEVI